MVGLDVQHSDGPCDLRVSVSLEKLDVSRCKRVTMSCLSSLVQIPTLMSLTALSCGFYHSAVTVNSLNSKAKNSRLEVYLGE